MNYKKLLFIFGCGLALSLGKVNAQSTTFNYTGSLQTWTVPCGVTSDNNYNKRCTGRNSVFYGAGGLGSKYPVLLQLHLERFLILSWDRQQVQHSRPLLLCRRRRRRLMYGIVQVLPFL